MLRHKYTKKRMKNKYNRKKRTRKQFRGGGGKSHQHQPIIVLRKEELAGR